MSGLFGSARQLCRSLLMSRPAHPAVLPPVVSNQHRFTSSNSDDSSYNAYQEYETPSPFVPIKHGRKFGYTMKYYKGGPLPRDEKHKDMPYGYFPKFDAKKRDQWVKTKAQFGQNDYIDILGDGTVHPVELMTGPLYLRGFKGNELMRLSRRLTFEGKFLERNRPAEFHNIHKQIDFLYKRYNHYRGHKNYWSGKRKGIKSRLFNLQKW